MELCEKSKINELLKNIREEKGLTREELANKINCTRLAVYKIEKNITQPNYRLLCRWFRICGWHFVASKIEEQVFDIPMTKTPRKKSDQEEMSQ